MDLLTYPVRYSRNGIRLRSRLQRVDLSRVQPRQRQPRSTEECNVREETDGSSLGGGFSVWNQSSEGNNHGQALADGTNEEELAATHTLDGEPRGRGEDGVNDHVDAAEEEGHVVSDTDGVLEAFERR